MPTSAGNVGVDYTFGYFDSNTNTQVPLGNVQDVKVTANKHNLENRPYNGVPIFDYAEDGYSFTFTIVRDNATLEKIARAREANFNAGGLNRSGYLNETVKNVDGTTSRTQYYGFVFFLTGRGDISREKLVMQHAEGRASGSRAI